MVLVDNIPSMEEFAKRHPEIVQEYEKLLRDQSQQTSFKGDGETAAQIRKRANELYKSRRCHRALELYTKSVKAAADDDEQLALALGNRSAVTFELKQYELALRDIQSALSLKSLPPAVKKRLLIRRAKCFHISCSGSFFLKAYDAVMDECTAMESPLTSAERKSLDNLKATLAPTNFPPLSDDVMKVHQNLSRCLPSATECIEMKASDTRGRYLQAQQSLPAGSVLICEEPYVSVLLPDHWTSHCYHCLREVHSSPVFCRRKGCKIRYCTVECQRSSFTSYHQYECTLLPVIVNTGIGHLAYRVVAATGLQALLAHRDSLLHQAPVRQCHQAYDAVYDLVTNAQHIQPSDMFHYCKTAQLLVMCLKTSQFFPSISDDHPDTIYVGSLLLRHIQQLICNAHAITVVRVEDGDEATVASQTQNRLASAIYPTASLMNHSCRPNIVLSFVGSKLIVKNTETLKPGDEVFNSYGPHYLKMEREERQRSLRAQYYFDCDCEPCSAEAGSITSLKFLHCIRCGGQSQLINESQAKCKQCSLSYDARLQLEKLMQAQQLIEQAKTSPADKALAKVKRAIGILTDEVVHKFSLDLLNALDLQSQLYASAGDMQACAESLLRGIVILEHIYPELSVERAHEYHKLSEVLCNVHQYAKALQYARKACSIFKHQYSWSHDLVKETELLCRQIEGVQT